MLALHREQGVASSLLASCLQTDTKVTLYVQTSNVTAIQFYSNRNFQICETVENYYRRTDCQAAHKMEYSHT